MENENKNPIDEALEPELTEAAETAEPTEPVEEALPEDKEKEDEMAILKRKNDELGDKYLRLMAEYDNFRKRSQREREEIYPNATANAVAKFLPVLDNFERAAAFPHAEDDFGKGFDLIYQGFQDVLKNLGVEAVGEVGEPFDPAFHNAVMHIEDEALGENVISQVLQKGYRIGDKVIRYAMVQTAN